MNSSSIARAQQDPFDATLQLWGRAYGVKLRDDEPKRSSHAIAKAMETGKKSRTVYAMDAAGHRTTGRREYMARGLGSCGVLIVPASYVDPVPCSDDSGRHRGLAADPLNTPHVSAAQSAWLELERHFPIQAKIIALEYQRPDLPNQSARATEAGVDLKRYERELERARHWMRCGVVMAGVVGRAEEAFAQRA